MKVKDPGVKVSIHDLVKPLTLESISGNYYRKVLINKLSRKTLSHLVYISLGVLVKHYNDEYEQKYVKEHPYCTNWPVKKKGEDENV